jgi:hypothetical protein
MAHFAHHAIIPTTEAMSFAKEREFIHEVVRYEEVGAPTLKSASPRIEF